MARSATRPKLRRSTPRTSCCSFRGPRFSRRTVTEASGTIQHVSDTARWVALYRAMESERPDALFHDPYARRLAGARGEQILASLPKGRTWAWAMIVRTAVMDELILRAVARRRRNGAEPRRRFGHATVPPAARSLAPLD